MDESEVANRLRQQRKLDHLEAVRRLAPDKAPGPSFDDVALLANCAPELDWDEVSLATEICGVRLASPLIINAMTGGAPETAEVNRRLAQAARRHGLAMAVGSETAALKNPAMAYTYRVVRECYPEGVLLANIGMGSTPEAALAAITLIDAQLLQVHWNVGQELFMAEGERRFRGSLAALAAVAAASPVPVVAKEVGQGIGAEEARRLVAHGARAIDVGGRGGTNFLAVEAWRQGKTLAEAWQQFGIPTPAALCETLWAVGDQVPVIASGGIRDAHDVAKAMALGAAACGMAGPIWRLLAEPDGDNRLDAFLHDLHWTLRAILVMTGCRHWQDLRARPLVIGGGLREWLTARGMARWWRRKGRGQASPTA